MKFCTKIQILRSHADDQGVRVIDEFHLLDVSLVPDDHEFGLHGDVLHIEGQQESVRT